MRILKIIPGSGEGFLCENCLRDQALIAELRWKGHEVIVIPVYLPMPFTLKNLGPSVPPFYGAVRVFLEHRFPVFRHAPRWFKRWLDSPRVLRLAGKWGGASSSQNLGDLTLSVLRGEHGGQAGELEMLCNWIRDTQEKPDIIHLSNALFLGMARRLKTVLNVPIVCSLQDEDTWIDAMPGPTASLIWTEIRARIPDVTGFITVSQYYANKLPPRLTIPARLVRVVHPGVDVSGNFQHSQCPPSWNVLLDPDDLESLGFILQAFAYARQHPACADLHLHCSGISGKSHHVRTRLRQIKASLKRYGLRQSVRFTPPILRDAERLAFIQSSSVFTVLHHADLAFDLSVLEAMGCGIPVFQPSTGANPEILALAEGGLVFEPNNAGALSEALVELFQEPSHIDVLAYCGRREVAQQFSVDRMARETVVAYEMFHKDFAPFITLRKPQTKGTK